MRLAAIQMVSGNDLSDNLVQARELLEQAKAKDAELVLLPENFAMFATPKLLEVATEEKSVETLQHFLAMQSKSLNMAIVGGTVPLLTQDSGDEDKGRRVRAASLFYDATGKCIARYDKIHLFDVLVDDAQGSYCESDNIEPGDNVVTVEWNGISVGMSVCYDLRFPELYKILMNKGADLLLVPAAFTQATGEAHWLSLLRSRAIETQCAVVGANQGGEETDILHITQTWRFVISKPGTKAIVNWI
ncbi:MAG: hypothetical protein JKY67_03145, partial [Pseudomonadales bacterium]|nr:hypothetical protein [Pseudomonadales bacterium]